jgi:16S rRNA A1518/A1519 N6-dimethyltransferase RsmA/KsgA/DIM1 with predicted DNA glycosylase/AP lyase activity
MDADQAIAFITPAVRPGSADIWADLGAGTGTFTRALADLIGAGGTVYAVERDKASLTSLARAAAHMPATAAQIYVVAGDFEQGVMLPPLDGVLIANALHYDRRVPNQWVPYPVAPSRLASIASKAGLAAPVVVSTMPSAFGPPMYCAVLETGAGPSRGATR